MELVIGEVLDRFTLDAIRETAKGVAFADGKASAGKYAKGVKNNAQAAPSDDRQAILDTVEKALLASPVFQSAARPHHFVSLILSRYRDGQTYGTHVDDALMAGGRTDLSFTLFLNEPDSYDGGELVVEDRLEDRAVKLQAGDMILYPSSSLHHVAPVTRGERLAVVGWVTSWINDPRQREILFDLDQCIAEAWEKDGKTAHFDRLTKSRSNLLRMWAKA